MRLSYMKEKKLGSEQNRKFCCHLRLFDVAGKIQQQLLFPPYSNSMQIRSYALRSTNMNSIFLDSRYYVIICYLSSTYSGGPHWCHRQTRFKARAMNNEGLPKSLISTVRNPYDIVSPTQKIKKKIEIQPEYHQMQLDFDRFPLCCFHIEMKVWRCHVSCGV